MSLLSDESRLNILREEIGEIDEIFVASSDFIEMNTDLPMIRESDFDVEEDMLTSKKQDYALYVLTDDETVAPVPEDLLD